MCHVKCFEVNSMLELEQSKFSCTYTFNVILFYYWYQYLYDYMDEGSVYYCLIGKHLTLANDTSIFIVKAVVGAVCCLAVCELELCTIAVHIIQSNQTISTTKSLYSGCIWGRY